MSRAEGGPARAVPRAWWAVALALQLLPFATRPALIGGDEPHYALMAHSLAVDHDLDLDADYRAVAAGSPAAGSKHAGAVLEPHLRRVGGVELFIHPLGVPLLAAPVLALEHALAPSPREPAPDLPLGILTLALTFAALVAGARLLGRWVGDARLGAAAALLVYFGSSLWFQSRTFFTEPYTWSLMVLALVALADERLLLGGALLGLVLLSKETALLLVGAAWLALWRLRGTRAAALAAIGPAVAAALWVARNLLLVHRALVPSQPFQLGAPATGALGLLIAPTRGLVWFAPLLLVAPFGWRRVAGAPAFPRDALAADARRRRVVDLALASAALAYFVVTACWIDWRGGSGYGPRLLVPAMPALAVPLAYLLRRCRVTHRAALGGLALAGFTVGWCAALAPVRAFWSSLGATMLRAAPLAALAGLVLGALLVRALLLALQPGGTTAAPSSGDRRSVQAGASPGGSQGQASVHTSTPS